MRKTEVTICVATYKRPNMLLDLLQSLKKLELTGNLKIQVIVIDNDAAGSAEQSVIKFRPEITFDLIYDIEPCHGISYARNRALQHVNTEYFAFLDDDEVVQPRWLTSMLATLKQYDADVVFGPVVSLLPEDAPAWALNHPSFSRTSRPTGHSVQHGATNNVMMRSVALGEPPQTFDSSYSLTGGEDTEFFHRLHLAGKRLVWCDEAVASEQVPPARLTTSWVYQRAFRGGQCFSRIFVRHFPWRRKIVWAATKPGQMIAGSMLLPFVRLLSFPAYVRLCCRVLAALGQLTGLVDSLRYQEYSADRISVEKPSITFGARK